VTRFLGFLVEILPDHRNLLILESGASRFCFKFLQEGSGILTEWLMEPLCSMRLVCGRFEVECGKRKKKEEGTG
jgi:hypothetical protein